MGRCQAALGTPAWHGRGVANRGESDALRKQRKICTDARVAHSVVGGKSTAGIKHCRHKTSAWPGEGHHPVGTGIACAVDDTVFPVEVCRSAGMGWSKGNVTQDARTAKAPCVSCIAVFVWSHGALSRSPSLHPLSSARASIHQGRRGRCDRQDALGPAFRNCASLQAPELRLSVSP